ncbi:hypothetical protein FRB93_001281 [Tulasnella sp. JGI-2019a]|nr:hypothetical protein FRB93_001281 [Tulasnella sp. JGI-2019a]
MLFSASALAKSVVMGLLMASLPVPFRRIVVSPALPISTITQLLSLEGPGGGFDVPKEKCPPDIGSGGSLGEVTVRSAPPSTISSHHASTTYHHSSKSSSSLPSSLSGVSAQIKKQSPGSTLIHSSTDGPVDLVKKPQDNINTTARSTITSPRTAMVGYHQTTAPFDMPLTPPNSTPGSSPERVNHQNHTHQYKHQQGSTTNNTSSQPMNIVKTSTRVVDGFTISFKEPSAFLETPPSTPEMKAMAVGGWMDQANPALAFLRNIFKPHGAREALPFATSVTIDTQEGVTWEGIVLSLTGKPKTLYVNGKGAESVQLRESIVALLDLAGEHLECEAFVIALERKTPALAGLIHSLLYVSGTVVSKPPFEVDEDYVLVGIEM